MERMPLRYVGPYPPCHPYGRAPGASGRLKTPSCACRCGGVPPRISTQYSHCCMAPEATPPAPALITPEDTMTLYDKAAAAAIATSAPTGDIQQSSEIDISSSSRVQIHVNYRADGAAKTLYLYPEVRHTVGGTAYWRPALPAAYDVTGAVIDSEGYLPVDVASPVLKVPGIDAQDVLVTVEIPVPVGMAFRVGYAEDGYDAGHPATLQILGATSRGAP